MKKIILVGAIVVLAACGNSKNDSAAGGTTGGTGAVTTAANSGDTTASNDASTDDTITVSDFSDMPPKCIELLGQFLKKIEPTVSGVDWDKATVTEFEAFGEKFKAESDSFDAETTAAGCDKYNLDGNDQKQFDQMAALAAAEAPGTLGFINFLKSLTDSATATGDIPSDCAGTIAAIEPFLTKGETMKDLTIAEVTQLGQLMTGIQTNCTAEEATAFFARPDVTSFVSG